MSQQLVMFHGGWYGEQGEEKRKREKGGKKKEEKKKRKRKIRQRRKIERENERDSVIFSPSFLWLMFVTHNIFLFIFNS